MSFVVLAGCSNEARASTPITPTPPSFVMPGDPPLGLAVAPALSAVVRHDVVVRDGIPQTLTRARLPRDVVDELDDAFAGRVDLFARVGARTPLTIWTDSSELVAAKVILDGRTRLFVARYHGPLAPHGFYDADGRSMTSAIRARPVKLSLITSRFGDRFDAFTGAPSTHHGIDYGVPIGTPVVSVGRGRVVAAGTSKRAGNYLRVGHSGGFVSLYLHLDRFEPGIRVGSIVDQGQVIASSGNTGRSTGPHLHYELHLAGTALDPLATLPPPLTALGPMARRQHLAFLNQLEAMHERGTDGQDQHPGARP